MSRTVHHALLAAVARLLRPLVRILLRNGVPYKTFADLAKSVYVDVSAYEFGIAGRKQSVSRVSIITGLSRKEVSRVSSLPDPGHEDAIERYNRAARVIGGWVRDKKFKNDQDEPADLPMEGPGRSFHRLVRRFGGDVPARAVLDELLRVGAVELAGEDSIRLIQRAYIPKTDRSGMLDILGTDVKDLISTIDHNMAGKGRESFFQRKVVYDNLPSEIIRKLRGLAATKGQSWLEEMDRWLSRQDRDINPSVRGSGRVRAGIGIYYFEEESDGKGATV